MDSALKSGPAKSYVGELLGSEFKNDPGVLATPLPHLEALERPDQSDKSGLRRYFEKNSELRSELTHWWIRRMIAAVNPVNEKLTFLWHNHFATSALQGGAPRAMANQNEKLRALCLGDFRSLALAMLTDAALIIWLDGQQNKAGAPNENLAREFLELFALGHGSGYSEKDVREGAKALTGWTVKDFVDVRFVADRHDNSTKTILGTTGNIGLEAFCDIVLAEPKSAIYVARRLWQQLASDEPPSDAALQRLLVAYGTSRDLHALTTAILTDPYFLGSSATVVTSPVEWLVGLLRAVQTPLHDIRQIEHIARTLKSLGQLPFYPPDVGGWPRGRAWLSSAAANIRFRIASKAVNDGDVSLVAEAAATDRIDAAGYLIGVGAWSERTAAVMKPFRDNPTALVAVAVNTPEYLTS